MEFLILILTSDPDHYSDPDSTLKTGSGTKEKGPDPTGSRSAKLLIA